MDAMEREVAKVVRTGCRSIEESISTRCRSLAVQYFVGQETRNILSDSSKIARSIACLFFLHLCGGSGSPFFGDSCRSAIVSIYVAEERSV